VSGTNGDGAPPPPPTCPSNCSPPSSPSPSCPSIRTTPRLAACAPHVVVRPPRNSMYGQQTRCGVARFWMKETRLAIVQARDDVALYTAGRWWRVPSRLAPRALWPRGRRCVPTHSLPSSSSLSSPLLSCFLLFLVNLRRVKCTNTMFKTQVHRASLKGCFLLHVCTAA
jgi:hypothetical protein